MSTDKLEQIKKIIKENSAQPQLMRLVYISQVGKKANICGMLFEFLGETLAPTGSDWWEQDVEYLFSIDGLKVRVHAFFSSWGDRDEDTLLFRMELAE
jgi:hypothetical protein